MAYSPIDEHQKIVEANHRRIHLCAMVIEEVLDTLIDPLYPDDKADLLLATEELTEHVLELLYDVRGMVWQEAPEQDF